MTTLQKEICDCKKEHPEITAGESGVNKEELCRKICGNILQGLLEGYEELKDKYPEKVEEFQPKIEEIKKQMQENRINRKIEEALSV